MQGYVICCTMTAHEKGKETIVTSYKSRMGPYKEKSTKEICSMCVVVVGYRLVQGPIAIITRHGCGSGCWTRKNDWRKAIINIWIRISIIKNTTKSRKNWCRS